MAHRDEPDGGESSCYANLVCRVCLGMLSEKNHDECQRRENEVSNTPVKE